MKSKRLIIYLLSSTLFFLISCASQEKKDNWIVAKGKYAQTWVDGVIWMEITFNSTQECLNNVNYELNNNPEVRKQIFVDKSLSLVCEEKPFNRDRILFDSTFKVIPAGAGLFYEGYIRLATSNEKYSTWFIEKEICEIVSSELKSQNKNQDLVCP
jgi:hypothetical protein